MSLDVYLTVAEPVHRDESSGIYVRRDGQTVEVTLAEWEEMYPDRDPVVASSAVFQETGEVYWSNITHNLGKMAREAGLYEPLWAPEEIDATRAHQLIAPIRDGLATLVSDPDRFKAFNPENGWGDYDGLCQFAADYLAACERWPEAEVRVWA